MSVRVQWTGLGEFEQQLRNLPDRLTAEAGREALAAANSMAVQVRTIYGQHAITGGLRDSVTVEVQEQSRAGVAVRVRARSPIAWLFDNGSQARHWLNGKSTGKMWGKRPPAHVFVRTAVRQRRSMFDRLIGMVRREGFKVNGA